MTITAEIYWDSQETTNPGLAYRLRDDETGHEEDSGGIDDLRELADVLNAADWWVWRESETITHGLGEDLPTFGGTEPDDATGIYSWDQTHLLVSGCSGLEVIPRPACTEDDDDGLGPDDDCGHWDCSDDLS
jgi:hypothetical protein